MTLVFAHRGLHDQARENTLAAFAAARAAGADGVELDVRRSADGDLVVHHDARLAGRAICETPTAGLPDYVPTLAAALAACDGMVVNVEIKNLARRSEPVYDATGDFARQVVEALGASGRADRCQVSCFDLATCAAARAAAPDLYVAWLLAPRLDAVARLARAADAGLSAVNPQRASVDARLVSAARARGLELNVWTVNRRRDLAAMVALGVEGIITDDPAAALAEVLRPGGPRAPMA